MIINNKEVNINDLVKEVYDDKNLIKKRKNNIYLSDNDILLLKKYDINYMKYNSIKSLIFDIEEILNEEEDNELEALEEKLAELNYYNYTNK